MGGGGEGGGTEGGRGIGFETTDVHTRLQICGSDSRAIWDISLNLS